MIFYPVNQYTFLESLRTSFGVVCNAGFQTSSEVIYLGKRLLVIPVKGQYEQLCNVAALQQLGVSSLDKINKHSIDKIKFWLDSNPVKMKFKNNLDGLLKKKIN